MAFEMADPDRRVEQDPAMLAEHRSSPVRTFALEVARGPTPDVGGGVDAASVPAMRGQKDAVQAAHSGHRLAARTDRASREAREFEAKFRIVGLGEAPQGRAQPAAEFGRAVDLAQQPDQIQHIGMIGGPLPRRYVFGRFFVHLSESQHRAFPGPPGLRPTG